MGRPKVNIDRLRQFDRTEWLEFEAQILAAIEQEQAQRMSQRQEEGQKKRGRRRR
ncbi:MAG: hypothetical protein H5T86_02255 [Armatimonadetes bacterium]|nr:hypothetical protein [Armatimonadota bacterium]